MNKEDNHLNFFYHQKKKNHLKKKKKNKTQFKDELYANNIIYYSNFYTI